MAKIKLRINKKYTSRLTYGNNLNGILKSEWIPIFNGPYNWANTMALHSKFHTTFSWDITFLGSRQSSTFINVCFRINGLWIMNVIRSAQQDGYGAVGNGSVISHCNHKANYVHRSRLNLMVAVMNSTTIFYCPQFHVRFRQDSKGSQGRPCTRERPSLLLSKRRSTSEHGHVQERTKIVVMDLDENEATIPMPVKASQI